MTMTFECEVGSSVQSVCCAESGFGQHIITSDLISNAKKRKYEREAEITCEKGAFCLKMLLYHN